MGPILTIDLMGPLDFSICNLKDWNKAGSTFAVSKINPCAVMHYLDNMCRYMSRDNVPYFSLCSGEMKLNDLEEHFLYFLLVFQLFFLL